ncbi:MAG: flagellar motor switch protein FliM [Rhodobiaceae bacterium]|nr:flagellar motor switch protein FliM [Rhodobiaceae bacterium]
MADDDLDEDVGADWGDAMAEQAAGEGGGQDDDSLAAEWGQALEDQGIDDDALAAEWSAAEDASADTSGGKGYRAADDRVLNQDEIDNLLGFDAAGGFGDEHVGIRAIIESALVSYERLPMLEIIFDRLVRLMTTSLRNFTSDNVEVSLDTIKSVRFGEYLDSIPLPAMLSVFKAKEWDNYGLMTVDSSLIYSVVDVLLGGRRGSVAIRVEGRPYTTIETTLAQRLVEVVLADAENAFAPLSPVEFQLERLETNPRFASISRPANAAILVEFRIDMENRGGKMEILLPYATLEPIRELLLQMFMGEKFGRDSIWESHLATELWAAQIEIKAVLKEMNLPVSRILNLREGDTILMGCEPDDDVYLKCGDTHLTTGKLGRIKDHVSVSVNQKLRPPNVTMAVFESMEKKPEEKQP